MSHASRHGPRTFCEIGAISPPIGFRPHRVKPHRIKNVLRRPVNRLHRVGVQRDQAARRETAAGLDVWKHERHRVGTESAQLPHPSNRRQIQRLDVYNIGSSNRAVCFAVAELSNGVWAFTFRDSAGGLFRVAPTLLRPLSARTRRLFPEVTNGGSRRRAARNIPPAIRGLT